MVSLPLLLERLCMKKGLSRWGKALFFQMCGWLCDVDVAGDLDFLFLHLREYEGENAVLDLGGDAVLLYILRQCVGLLVVGVGELATQVVLFLVLLLVLEFVLDGDVQVAFVVDADAAELLLKARSRDLHGVSILIDFDVDSGCCTWCGCNDIGVEEIIEYCGEPTVLKHYG